MITDNLRVILCANGKGERFESSRVTKVLLEIGGEPVLHRAIRLIDKIIKPLEITVVGEDQRLLRHPAILLYPTVTGNPLPGYCFGESAVGIIPPSPHAPQATPLPVASPLSYLILMGDIWWTESGIHQLLGLDDGYIQVFGHRLHSEWHNPEIFGAYIPRLFTDHWLEGLDYVNKHRIKNISCGWTMYRWLHGIPLNEDKIIGGWTEIDWRCIDIDVPADFYMAKKMAELERKETK